MSEQGKANRWSVLTGRKWVIGPIGGFLLFVAWCVLLFIRGPEPISGGLSVSDWLREPGNDKGVLSDPKRVAVVEGFGPKAIPHFISHYRSALNAIWIKNSWLGMFDLKRKLYKPGHDIPPGRRKNQSLIALTILARNHPEKVDRFFRKELKSPRRLEVLKTIGHAGPQYFSLLTNVVAQADPIETPAAAVSLANIGKEAEAAVPLLLNTITNHPTRGRDWWVALYSLEHIGREHEATVPGLVSLVSSTNENARWASASVLIKMREHREAFLPAFARVLNSPIVGTNDPAKYVLTYLNQDRKLLDPELMVPALFRRLKEVIPKEGPFYNETTQTIFYLQWISRYGAHAKEVIPLVEKELLPRRILDASRALEHAMRNIDPNWRR